MGHVPKQRVLCFSGRLLVQVVQKFAEVPLPQSNATCLTCARPFAASCHSSAAAGCAVLSAQITGFARCFAQSSHGVHAGLVQEIQRSAHVYSGSAVKGDGNYEIAARIRGQVADQHPEQESTSKLRVRGSDSQGCLRLQCNGL